MSNRKLTLEPPAPFPPPPPIDGEFPEADPEPTTLEEETRVQLARLRQAYAECVAHKNDALAECRRLRSQDPSPVPLLLWCPCCGGRHIDEGEFATKVHHTHACQHCGAVWRPAIVATVGVRFLPGFKNEAQT